MSNVIVNINGECTNSADAKISVFDRGFLYGDSIYEVTQTLEQTPFLLEDHLTRLQYSAAKIGLTIPLSMDELKKQLARALVKLNVNQAYIRIIITRGEGEIGLDPALAGTGNFVIITKELPDYPQTWYREGVSVIVANTLRNTKESVDPNVKSGNYLNNVLAYAEAKKLGAFDAIMLNHQGFVTECTTSNLWIVKDGVLLTPPLESGLLEGITRKHLLTLCQTHGLPLSVAPISEAELHAADEIFLTSTTKRCVPITKLDAATIGSGKPGPITLQISKLYDDFVDSLFTREKAEWAQVLKSLKT